MTSLLAEWESTYHGSQAKRDAANAAVTEKDETREKFAKRIRTISKFIQANPEISNEARKEAGLPIHSDNRKSKPAPSTMPIGFVEWQTPLQHLLRWVDSATPTRRARAANATGCEIYQYIGADMPDNFDEFRFVGVCSRSPKKIEYPRVFCGQTAFYRLRWVNAKGEAGPWSEVVMAMING